MGFFIAFRACFYTEENRGNSGERVASSVAAVKPQSLTGTVNARDADGE